LEPIVAQIERLGDALWQREHLYDVTWEEFEHLVGELYRIRGYDVEVTQRTDDLGIDVWAERDGERTAIQVKQFSEGNTVGRETLQKLLSTIARGEADNVVVITSGEFAHTAKQYAKDTTGMQLIDGEELLELLSESEIPPPV
jgi:HJR/Mrr/RecB family endonuclease